MPSSFDSIYFNEMFSGIVHIADKTVILHYFCLFVFDLSMTRTLNESKYHDLVSNEGFNKGRV